MDVSPPSRDRLIAALAEAQNRVITTKQLKALGASKGFIENRVEEGRLFRVTRGVFLVGVPTLDWSALRRTALLVGGPSSYLDDLTAAHMRAILPPNPTIATASRAGLRPRTFQTDLATPSGRPGTITLTGAAADDNELEVVEHFRVATVPRTLIDVAGRHPRRLEKAWKEAQYRNLIDWDRTGALADSTRRDGSALVAAKVRSHLGIDLGLPESPAEFEAIQLVLRAGAPQPLVNHGFWVGSELRRPDLYWALARLIVEIDGWDGHKSRESFEDDRLRDAEFLALGILTLRFTARRMRAEPQRCADLILQQLAQRSRG